MTAISLWRIELLLDDNILFTADGQDTQHHNRCYQQIAIIGSPESPEGYSVLHV